MTAPTPTPHPASGASGEGTSGSRPAFQASGILSSCELHRLRLDRWWSNEPRALVCMCNPGGAGPTTNDPTVWRLFDLLYGRPGIGGFTVVNWDTYRSPSPKVLHAFRARKMSIGPDGYDARVRENCAMIHELAANAAVRIVAWGALVPSCRHRRLVIEAMSHGYRHDLYAFGLTREGYPKHPLARGQHRIPNDAPLTVWLKAHAKRDAA